MSEKSTKGFLSERELEHIKNHKYVAGTYSWLDLKMNPFWLKCAHYIPYVIPN